MEPQQVRRIVRRWAAVGLLTALLGAAVAYVVSHMMPQLYVAEGRVQVQVAPNTPNPADIVNTDAALITQGVILQRVIAQLHLDERASALQAHVQVSPQPGTQILAVSVTDPNPVHAASIANALMNQFVAQVTSPTAPPDAGPLRGRVSALQDRLRTAESARDQAVRAHQDTSALDEEIAETTGELGLITDQLRAQGQTAGTESAASVVSPATVPASPSLPRVGVNTAIGGFVGLLVGLLLVALRTSFAPRLDDESDVRSRLDLPTLGVIPTFGGPAQPSHGRRHIEGMVAAGEAYRRLRTNLLCSTGDVPLRTVVVTSARSGEGRTTTAANLAGVVAALGQRVLLVDADLRHPGQRELFGGTGDRGVADVLQVLESSPPSAGRTGGDDLAPEPAKATSGRRRRPQVSAPVRATDFPNLDLLDSGPPPPNPGELLGSRHIQEFLSDLQRHHDLVVIDTSAAGTFSDALVLARHASATILVVEAGRTSVQDARQTIDALQTVGARIIGVVLNRGHAPMIDGVPDMTETARRVSPLRAHPWVPRAHGTR